MAYAHEAIKHFARRIYLSKRHPADKGFTAPKGFVCTPADQPDFKPAKHDNKESGDSHVGKRTKKIKKTRPIQHV